MSELMDLKLENAKLKEDIKKVAKQAVFELELKDHEIRCRNTDFNYLIQMLLSCVERAEGIIDGGPVTREAEKHVHAWRTRKDGP